ncbi:MAG TPA: hypothetical protein DEP66_02055 [Acidimicrobiaceae bacterium]|nr:hypothetical protein [Acidimicrobiaceae bacterium]HCB37016.1 hypothetical protein [Acidimicrobiaceae bacterium]
MTVSLVIIAVGLAVAVVVLGVRLGLVARQRNTARTELTRHEARAQAQEDNAAHFKLVASEIADQGVAKLLEQAKEQFKSQVDLSDKDLAARQQEIAGLLAPITKTLDIFQSQVRDMESNRSRTYGELHKVTSTLSKDTAGLLGILKSAPARGQWGEQTLVNILEMAGMREGVDFTTQESTTTDDGRVRPDVMVRIPGRRVVVIDSKVPFDHYHEGYKAAEAGDDALAEREWAEHAKLILGHARDLHNRDYSTHVQGSLDFVVMFIPADPILDAAVKVRPDLWPDVWEKHRVLIVTPTPLLAFLRTVAAIWTEQTAKENADKIAATARELYNRVRRFVSHIDKIGDGLKSAVDAYNSTVRSHTARLLPFARQLDELGAGESLEDKKVPELDELEVLPIGHESDDETGAARDVA